MKHSKSKYPIGATWKSVNEINGKTGTIWLAEISDYGYEIWRWSVGYDDGSGMDFDWAVSYAACKRHIPLRTKFKRIK